LVLAHVSDLHFGRIAGPRVADALVADVEEHSPDLVVVGGDLTQRSRFREWRGVDALLSSFSSPCLVIAGNHDVYPWWFPVRRLLVPLLRYRSRGLDIRGTWSGDGVAVAALNSAHGWTVKGGRFRRADLELAASHFGRHPDTRLKVLLVHHQIVPSRFASRGDVAAGSRRVLECAAAAGADLVLDGHIHRSAVGVLEAGGRTLVHSSAGTATSDRGRFEDRGRNLYSIVRMPGSDILEIEERVYDDADGAFTLERRTSFRRASGNWSVDPAK